MALNTGPQLTEGFVVGRSDRSGPGNWELQDYIDALTGLKTADMFSSNTKRQSKD